MIDRKMKDAFLGEEGGSVQYYQRKYYICVFIVYFMDSQNSLWVSDYTIFTLKKKKKNYFRV